MMNLVFCLLCASTVVVFAIPIDNGLVGEPEIECGPRSVIVFFNVQNNFVGTVYAKNHHADEACATKGDNTLKAGIELSFENCGLVRERSVTPRGIYVTTEVVISFHPTFLTKIDKSLKIQCFYMEADKTVSQELEVSALTTAILQTLIVPMPVCRYDILAGGPDGDPTQFALIGDQVFHKWTCDTDTLDTFCMVVYGCFVDDGAGDKIQLLDDEGCALDKYLLGNVEYPTDLMAGKEAHVFKYADRANLYFNCQIRITVKEPNDQCARPECSEPNRRLKRDTDTYIAVQDVSPSKALVVGDLDLTRENLVDQNLGSIQKMYMNSKHCISIGWSGFAVVSSVCVVFVVATATITILLLWYGKPKHLF